MTTYDEDILDNPFYQTLLTKFTELYDVATNSGWMVCIPRLGSAARLPMTRKDFENHLLVPSADEEEEEGKRYFVTPNAKKVVIEGDVIKTGGGFDGSRLVHILFQETNYGSRDTKYIVLCVDQPLEGEVCEEMKVANLLSADDCTKFLFSDSAGHRVQKQVDKLLKLVGTSFSIVDGDSMRSIVDAVRATITRTMQTVLKDSSVRKLCRQNQAYMANVKLAVETYVMDVLSSKVFPATCALSAKDDAALNKKTRNLTEIRPEHLGLDTDHCMSALPKARRELSLLNKFTTPIDKVFCLRRVILALSSPAAGQEGVTADDLLPLLIFLLIRSDTANWMGNMLYISQFMSTAGLGEFGFVLSSFEAAVQHVKDDQVQANNKLLKSPAAASFMRQRSDSTSQAHSSIDVFFEHVRQNDVETVRQLLTTKIEVDNSVLEKMCHPLCSCENCERLVSGRSAKDSSGDSLEVGANSRDDLGRTALHVAAKHGHSQMVQLLLDCGAVANSTDYHSSTALHLACRHGYISVVSVLISRIDDVNLQDNDGNTLLLLASAYGHEEVARSLFTLRKEVDVNVANERGDTPLHLAARWGYESIVKLLIKQHANAKIANRHKELAKHCTHNQRIIELLQEEIDRSAVEESYTVIKDPASVGEATASATVDHAEDRVHPVAAAAASNANEEFSRRPDLDRSPKSKHKTSSSSSPKSTLRRASQGQSIDGGSNGSSSRKKSKGSSSRTSPTGTVSLPPQANEQLTGNLSQLGKEIDHLLKLCADGDVQMVRYKLGLGGEESRESAVVYEESDLCHPLCDCEKCRKMKTGVAAAASAVKLSTESCNAEGMAALHVASLHGRRHVVQLLLRHGAMVNCKNNAKQTPLHLACQYNHQDVVMLLVDYNAKVGPPDINGRTPLHCCCANGHDASAAILLFHGGDVNAVDNRGNSPLHQAARWGHSTLVNTLLLHGASPLLKNQSQFKPFQMTQDDEVRSILDRAERGEIPIGSHRRRSSLGGHPTADNVVSARGANTPPISAAPAANQQGKASPPSSSRDRTSSLRTHDGVPPDAVREAMKSVTRDPTALTSSPSLDKLQFAVDHAMKRPSTGRLLASSSESSRSASSDSRPAGKTSATSSTADLGTTMQVTEPPSTSPATATASLESSEAAAKETVSRPAPTEPKVTEKQEIHHSGGPTNIDAPPRTGSAEPLGTDTATRSGGPATEAANANANARADDSAEATESNGNETKPNPVSPLQPTSPARSQSGRRLEELLFALEDRSLEQLRILANLSSDVQTFNRRQSLRHSRTNDRSGPSTASVHQYSITHFRTSRLRRVSTRDFSSPDLYIRPQSDAASASEHDSAAEDQSVTEAGQSAAATVTAHRLGTVASVQDNEQAG